MADILAGRRILALDFTGARRANSNSAQSNIGTVPTAGSPEVGVSVVAPTSGRVQVTVGGAIQDNTNTRRGYIEPEVYEGTDATGTPIETSPSTLRRLAIKGTNTSEPEFGSRTTVVEGLTPGTTYYFRVMVAGSAASPATVDFIQRSIDVIPAT